MPQRSGPPIFVCMKRHLSAEQRAAYEARRGAFRRLAKAIAAMTPEQRADLARKTIPLSIAGRAFSPYNTILLAMQKPAGTVFGGFRQWIEAGRCVRKGEHGAMIWCKGGSKSEAAPLESRNEEPTAAEVEAGSSLRFVVGTVFDVSQTEALIPRDETPGEPVIDVQAAEVPERLALTL